MKYSFPYYFTHPRYVFDQVCFRLSDRRWTEHLWKNFTGRELDLDNPRTFFEKLQWLKLYDRKARYTVMADKYAMKSFVASVLGDGFTVPTSGLWNRFDDIDFDTLPEKFVLKCTHDSGSIMFCKDKATFNREEAKIHFDKKIKDDYYHYFREWPYKGVPHRIMAEPCLTDVDGSRPKEFKIFTFEGEPRVYVVFTRNKETDDWSADFFDVNGEHLDVKAYNCNNAPIIPQVPEYLPQMVDAARRLAKGTHHLRVDFLTKDSRFFVQELTFFDEAGFPSFSSGEFDLLLGSWIDLPTASSR